MFGRGGDKVHQLCFLHAHTRQTRTITSPSRFPACCHTHTCHSFSSSLAGVWIVDVTSQMNFESSNFTPLTARAGPPEQETRSHECMHLQFFHIRGRMGQIWWKSPWMWKNVPYDHVRPWTVQHEVVLWRPTPPTLVSHSTGSTNTYLQHYSRMESGQALSSNRAANLGSSSLLPLQQSNGSEIFFSDSSGEMLMCVMDSS